MYNNRQLRETRRERLLEKRNKAIKVAEKYEELQAKVKEQNCGFLYLEWFQIQIWIEKMKNQ